MDDQRSKNAESSDTESLPYSLSVSDSGSLAESIGSFEIDSRDTTPVPGASFLRTKKDKKSGPQFLQFSKELRDLPVSAAWEYIRNHKNMANIAPGVIAYFNYLEGDGATGSTFIANYAPKFCEQHHLFADTKDERYVIHKVEVMDDNSHMYALRCVGGRYQKRYHLYFSFIKVVPHEVLGESSSTIKWRLQYEPQGPSILAPEETKVAYLAASDMIKDCHLVINRVHRPLINPAMSATMTKRLKVLRCRQARQQQTGSDQKKTEDPSEQRRKSSVQLVEVDDDGDDQDGQKKQMPSGQMRVQSCGSDEEELHLDSERSQTPKGKARARSLVQYNEGSDGEGVKRQRRSKSGVQQTLAKRELVTSSNNS